MYGKSKIASAKDKCKYHSYEEIPAVVFFKVRDTQDYQLMRPKPKTSTAWLKERFDLIYDEYFVKMNNPDAHQYIELRNKIGKFTYIKVTIKAVLAFIYTIPYNVSNHPEVVKMVREQLDELNKHLEQPIDYNADFLEELKRVLNVEIGILTDEIEIANQMIDMIRKDEKEITYDYYAELAALETAHGRTLDEKMKLPKYVELIKIALKKKRNGGK